jgi:hypothetical protein
MTDERWNALVEQAKKNFENVSVYTEDLLMETEDGLVKQGNQDILEFTNNNGEYKFSDSEMTHRIRFYKDDYGEWIELDSNNLNQML